LGLPHLCVSPPSEGVIGSPALRRRRFIDKLAIYAYNRIRVPHTKDRMAVMVGLMASIAILLIARASAHASLSGKRRKPASCYFPIDNRWNRWRGRPWKARFRAHPWSTGGMRHPSRLRPVGSPKPTPISPIPPIWRRSCVTPSEALPLQTGRKIRSPSLKAITCACRLVLMAKLFRGDAGRCDSKHADCRW
jgi:hypothetical protein